MSREATPKRVHLFEFNDSTFCPAFLRDSIVEILGRTIKKSGFYDPVLPIFKRFCEDAQCHAILDLCSGSGEPVSMLLTHLQSKGTTDITFHLSDLFPPEYGVSAAVNTHPDNIAYTSSPVDVLNVGVGPEHQARTMIAAFHHFRPEQARKILADTVAANKAICIIEPFPRRIKTTWPFFLNSFIPGMLNPFHSHKDRCLKLLFTNVLPLVPLLGWWDLVVSALRMHSRDECLAMVKDFNHYQWEYHELPIASGGAVTVFTGIPGESKS